MRTRIDVNTSRILSRLSSITPKANNILANQAEKDTEKFVPALTKTLANNTKVEKDEIIYPPPSRYLYNGKLMVDPQTGSAWASSGATKVLTNKDLVFTKSVHSEAQAHWFEASKALNMERWLDVYARAVKDELGN